MNLPIAINISNELQRQMTEWRHQIHQHPETAYEEFKTSQLVAEILASVGIEVHQNIAETGVIGVLRKGNSERSVGLRADMDALDILEENDLSYCSQVQGKMHACGHDGHTAMLLGAAVHLAKDVEFDGTIYFIFQPAEEVRGGAKAMIEEGLFKKFPMEMVFGLHNMPGIQTGKFSICEGPMMAAFAHFECEITGKGGHSSTPHLNIDPVQIGAELVQKWQSIITLDIPSSETAVISTTEFHAGTAFNVSPETATLRGSCRSLSNEIAALIERRMREIAEQTCHSRGAVCRFEYHQAYPVLINGAEGTKRAIKAAEAVVGKDMISSEQQPIMGSEDFAEMLLECPGAYIFLGNGTESRGGCMIHNPGYDFNDDNLSVGAQYWVTIACQHLND